MTTNDDRVNNTIYNLYHIEEKIGEHSQRFIDEDLSCCPGCAFGPKFSNLYKKEDRIRDQLILDMRNPKLNWHLQIHIIDIFFKFDWHWPEGSYCRVNR